MKNHIRINGQLLQTNKKWSHLKAKQKAWIMEMAKHKHDHFVQERGKLPVHGSHRSKQKVSGYLILRSNGYWTAE